LVPEQPFALGVTYPQSIIAAPMRSSPLGGTTNSGLAALSVLPTNDKWRMTLCLTRSGLRRQVGSRGWKRLAGCQHFW
jgi:hypothetical protein